MRLLTRADLDGLTSALLLQEVERIDRVEFAHPKDVQDGKVDVGPEDILANLPFDPRAKMWFDHHVTQGEAASRSTGGRFALAPSAARVIAEHYRSPRFERYRDLLTATDKLDAAQLTREDIVDPQGWILIGYTLDPRSTLGPFKEYFQHVMALAKEHDVAAILADERVAARVERLRREDAAFRVHLLERSRLEGNVVITDVRGLKDLPSGNRFLIYEIFPTANVSMRVASGHDGSYVSIQVGKSILNRSCPVNVGALLAKYGGGGHVGAGTAQPKSADAERVMGEIVAALKTG